MIIGLKGTLTAAALGVLSTACVVDGTGTDYDSAGGASGDDELVVSRQQGLYPNVGQLWLAASSSATTTLGVCFTNYSSSIATEVGWVRNAVETQWEGAANLNFTGFGACAGGEKIRINVVDNQSSTNGLGTAMSGMDLNFTFKNFSTGCAATGKREGCIRSIAVHEFGHALGLAHEQNRPDTPSSCTDAPQGSNGNYYWTYDARSVMNYCNPTWNNGGILSTLDKDGISRLYGGPGKTVKSGSKYWLRNQAGGAFGDIRTTKSGKFFNPFVSPVFTDADDGAFEVKRTSGTGDLRYGDTVTLKNDAAFVGYVVYSRSSPQLTVTLTATNWKLADPRSLSSTAVVGVNAPVTFVATSAGVQYYLAFGQFLPSTPTDAARWRLLGPK